MLDLRKGYPHPAEAPRRLIAKALNAVAARALSGELSLAYSDERGSERYLDALGSFIGAAEPRAPPVSDRLFATGGCSHGLELLASVLCRPGDVVVCESPTYFLAGQIFRDHGLQIETIGSDAQGLRVDALAYAIEHEGLRPKLVYTVSSCANPTGATLPHARRLALAELARRHRFWVVSDEAYQLLRWEPREPGADGGARAARPLRMATYEWEGAGGLEGGGLVSVGSWSKILSPALRAGWIEGRPELVAALASRGYVVSGGSPLGLSSELIAEAILSGDAALHLRGLCEAYRLRCAALCAALRAAQAGFAVREPAGGFTGGYFVWVRLPDWAPSCHAVERAALEAGVAVMPGAQCTAGGGADERARSGLDRHVRLCFAMLDGADIEEAVRRLSSATLATRPRSEGAR